MAIFGKKSGNDEVVAEKASPLSDVAKPVIEPEGGKLTVGPNIRLTGSEISDCDTVIVEGRVEATVDGRVMQISETGTFSGTVHIEMAEIRGRFDGDLTVRRRLTVCGTGKVSGKIRYGTLVVEEGGELSGDIESLAPVAAAPGKPAPAAGAAASAPAKAATSPLAPVEPRPTVHH